MHRYILPFTITFGLMFRSEIAITVYCLAMSTAQKILHSVFGYGSFREPQSDIIQTIIEGGDALVLMPTGGGKSLCYQIPALARNGCGIVISPLIALMQDQVNAMRQLGVRASFLNSSLDIRAARAVEEALLSGDLDLLYVAPERLTQERFLALLQQADIALFAIDEAHCVSQWGHDFRADYLKLSLLHEQFPNIPRIALTATADARTRAEIILRLNLGRARQFIASFDRPNIHYRIALKEKNPRAQLLRFLRAAFWLRHSSALALGRGLTAPAFCRLRSAFCRLRSAFCRLRSAFCGGNSTKAKIKYS